MNVSLEDSATTVTLYIDPVCPYAWIASQWLRGVAREFPIDLSFRTMSLAVLNQDPADPREAGRGSESAWRPVRVAEAIAATRGTDSLHRYLYEFGYRYHETRQRGRDTVLRDTLDTLGAASLYDAAADPVWDDAVIASHHAAIHEVADDVGTPILRVNDTSIFGPVLTSVPSPDNGLSIFDAVTTLMGYPEFVELKRSRDMTT